MSNETGFTKPQLFNWYRDCLLKMHRELSDTFNSEWKSTYHFKQANDCKTAKRLKLLNSSYQLAQKLDSWKTLQTFEKVWMGNRLSCSQFQKLPMTEIVRNLTLIKEMGK